MTDRSSKNDLARCPFCGGTKLEVWKNTVLCDECGASGPDLGHVDDRPGAIAAWNRRAAETSAPRACTKFTARPGGVFCITCERQEHEHSAVKTGAEP